MNIEDVVGNLDNPCGVAVQPDTGTIFVSDSGREDHSDRPEDQEGRGRDRRLSAGRIWQGADLQDWAVGPVVPGQEHALGRRRRAQG